MGGADDEKETAALRFTARRERMSLVACIVTGLSGGTFDDSTVPDTFRVVVFFVVFGFVVKTRLIYRWVFSSCSRLTRVSP